MTTDTSLALAERNVPRYTSYPTAPHFSASIGADIYRGWLEALPRDATLSLHIHVPWFKANQKLIDATALPRPAAFDAYLAAGEKKHSAAL